MAVKAEQDSSVVEPDEDEIEDQDADESTAGDQEETGTDAAKALGDAGKQAIDRMKVRLKAERDARRKAEQERDAAKGATEQERAQREADAKALTKANVRILRAEVRRAATGKLADPADALAFVDLDQFEVTDDGDVDEDEIATAIDDLLKKKPHLAAPQGQQQRFQGGADQGARKADTKSEEQRLTTELAEAQKARNFDRAIQIRQRLAEIARGAKSA